LNTSSKRTGQQKSKAAAVASHPNSITVVTTTHLLDSLIHRYIKTNLFYCEETQRDEHTDNYFIQDIIRDLYKKEAQDKCIR